MNQENTKTCQNMVKIAQALAALEKARDQAIDAYLKVVLPIFRAYDEAADRPFTVDLNVLEKAKACALEAYEKAEAQALAEYLAKVQAIGE